MASCWNPVSRAMRGARAVRDLQAGSLPTKISTKVDLTPLKAQSAAVSVTTAIRAWVEPHKLARNRGKRKPGPLLGAHSATVSAS